MCIRRIVLAAAACLVAGAPAAAEGPNLGKPLGEADIPYYARYTMPDGTGLPAGKGTATEGKAIYEAQCASCHGATGNEGPIMAPVGPAKDFAKPAGRFWPHATTMFDYVRRAMPFTAPKSLSDDEVYAVAAYLLWRNGLIEETTVVDAESLPKVQMPNRGNFVDLWEKQADKPY